MSRFSRLCSAFLEGVWLLILLLLPVFLNVWELHPFEFPKQTVLVALSLLLGGLFLGKGIAEVNILSHEPTKPLTKKTWLPTFCIVTLFLGLIVFLSSQTALSPSISFWGTTTRSQGIISILSYLLIFLVLVLEVKTEEQKNRIINVIVYSGFFVAVYAILQFLGIDWIGYQSTEYVVGQRVSSTIGNPVFLGGYLILTGIITLVDFLADPLSFPVFKNPIRTFFFSLIFLTQIMALFLTKSRGPILGLLGGGLFFLWGWAYLKGQKKLLRWGSLSVFLLGILGIALLAPFSPLQIKTQNPTMLRFQEIFLPHTGSGSWRAGIWQDALIAFFNQQGTPNALGNTDGLAASRLYIGYGQENTYLAVNRFFKPGLPTAVFDRAHNFLLDNLLAGGGVGTTVFLSFCTLLIFCLNTSIFGWLKTPKENFLWFGSSLVIIIVSVLLTENLLGESYGVLGASFGLLFALFISPLGIGYLFAPKKNDSKETNSTSLFQKIYLWGLGAALLAHGIETSFSFQVSETALLFWTIAALLVIGSQKKLVPIEETRQADEELLPTQKVFLGTALISAPIVVLLYNFFYLDAFKPNNFWATWLEAMGRLNTGKLSFLLFPFCLLLIVSGIFLLNKNEAKINFRQLIGTVFGSVLIPLLFSFYFALYLAQTPLTTAQQKIVDFIGYYVNWGWWSWGTILFFVFLTGTMLYRYSFPSLAESESPAIITPKNKDLKWEQPLSFVLLSCFLFVAFWAMNLICFKPTAAEIISQRVAALTNPSSVLDKINLSQKIIFLSTTPDRFDLLAQNCLEGASLSNLHIQDLATILNTGEKAAFLSLTKNSYDPLPVSLLGQIATKRYLTFADETVEKENKPFARQYTQLAERMSPYNGQLLYERVYVDYLVYNERQNVEKDLLRVIDLTPNLADAYWLLGVFYENQGKRSVDTQTADNYYDLAAKNYRLAFAKENTKIEYFEDLIYLFEQRSLNFDFFYAAYEQGIETAAPSLKWDLTIRLAELYRQNGNETLALQTAKDAYKLIPSNNNAARAEVIKFMNQSPPTK